MVGFASTLIPTNRLASLPALWLPEQTPESRSFQLHVDRFADSQSCVRSARFVASDALWRKELGRRGQKRSKPPVFGDGFVVAELEVHTHTNVAGAAVPLSLELMRYAPEQPRLSRRQGLSLKRFVLEDYSVSITAIRGAVRPTLVPSLGPEGQTTIYDFRFADKRYPELYLTWNPVSRNWPSRDRPEISRLVSEARLAWDRRIAAERWATLRRHSLAIFGLLLLVLLPIVLATIQRTSQHRR